MSDYLIKIGDTKLKYILRGGYEIQENQETKEYQENNNNWFGIKKQNVNLHYDLLGYDLTLLALTNVYPENTEDLYNFDYLQSKPNLEFDKNRWLNMAYYLFYCDKSTLKEIK